MFQTPNYPICALFNGPDVRKSLGMDSSKNLLTPKTKGRKPRTKCLESGPEGAAIARVWTFDREREAYHLRRSGLGRGILEPGERERLRARKRRAGRGGILVLGVISSTGSRRHAPGRGGPPPAGPASGALCTSRSGQRTRRQRSGVGAASPGGATNPCPSPEPRPLSG